MRIRSDLAHGRHGRPGRQLVPRARPAAGDGPHPEAITIEAHLQDLSETLPKATAGSAICPLDPSPCPIQFELCGKADLGVLTSAALDATPTSLATAAIRSRPQVAGGIKVEPAKSANGKITLWRTVYTPCGAGPDG